MIEPDAARFGGASCTASTPRELGRSTVRNLRLRVASHDGARSATLAVWSSGEHEITSRRIDAELGPLQATALDQGMNVQVLAPASEGRFIAVSVGALCAGTTRGYSCLRAVGLGPDGAASAPPYQPEPDTQQLEIVSSAPLRAADGSPTGVAVALVSRWAGANISLFRLDAAGRVTVDAHPIRSEGPGESPIELLAADGEQVVALGTEPSRLATDEHGDTVDRSFVLALGARRQPIAPAVAPGAPLRWAHARGSDLDLFYGLPGGRVRWLRVSGADGGFLDGTPTTLGPTTALPASPVFPALAITRGTLTFARTDLRGARVGTALALARASGRPVTSWSWDGATLHVVWGVREGREWVISESAITCETP